MPDPNTETIVLTAKIGGTDGNNVTLATTVSTNATITATASGATFSGGGDAAKIAPGTLVTIVGTNLADTTATADPNAESLPTTLANTQVYFDGVRAPLMYVSPTQITAQIPFEFLDTTSINAWVRTVHADGSVSVSTPVAVSIVVQNPGIFADPGPDPRTAMAVHSSSSATGTVSVDGTANAGDIATVSIEDRSYTYTVVSGDTLDYDPRCADRPDQPGSESDGQRRRHIRPHPAEGARRRSGRKRHPLFGFGQLPTPRSS